MAHDAQLTRLVADLKRQLEIANSQALHFKPAEDRRIGMPSVWELQNGHLKDQIDRIEERLAELGLVAR